jgi:PQQ-like domain
MLKTILQRIQHQITTLRSLPKYFIWIVSFTLVLVACNTPSEQVDQSSLGQATLVFPGLSPQIRLLEVEIAPINGDLTVKSGAGNKIQKSALTLPPRDPASTSPTLNPSLEFHDLTPGLHRVLARGLDASDGVVLYKIATTLMVLPGVRSDVTANTAPGTNKPRSNPAQQIYLERAVSTVMVRVEKPADAANNLIYSVQMGIHRAELNAKDTGFAATMWAVPTGRQLALIVEAKDRAGTVLYQGESVFDLPDVTKEITVNLERVDANTPLPSIVALNIEGSGMVGQAQKLKLEALAGPSGSAVTLKQARIQWGDGSSETSVLNGATATFELNHSYTSAGAQTISVQVQNSANRSTQATQVIAITDPQSPPSQNTNSLVRFEVQDVPWNADTVELRIKPEVVQTASDSRGATAEPERVLRLARANAMWTGLANLKKGSKYSLNLAARVDALGQTLQSTQNGTYPMLEPKAGTETLALKFSQLNAPAPGDDLTLQISPAGALLASKNDTKIFTVRAYNKSGIEVSTDGLGLEWLSSNANQVGIQAQTGNTNQALATPQVDSGSAFIMVRSQINPKLVSAPSSVVMAQVYDGVQLVPDEAVVFPPAQLPAVATTTPNFKNISDPDQAGNVTIGSFTDLEVQAVTETIPEGKAFRARTPLVLRGAGYPVGTLIMGSESAALAGRVTRSETRTGFTLMQIEQVAPTDILKSINLAFDGKNLQENGFINPENASTQQSLRTRATRSKAGLVCKPSGVTGDVATFEAEMSIQPVVIPSGTFRWKNDDIKQGVEEFSFKIEYGVTLEFVGTASIQSGVKFSYDCKPKNPLIETKIPIPMPQIRAFFSLTYTMDPIFSIEGTIKGGPRFEYRSKFVLGTKENGESGFKYTDPPRKVETISKEPKFELKSVEVSPSNQWIQSVTAELGQIEVGLNLFVGSQGKFNFKPGGDLIALCGLYLSKICESLVKNLDKARLDFAQFKVGGKLDLAWANTRAVLKVQDDLSKALFGRSGEIGVGSDAINDFLKNVFKFPADISASTTFEVTDFPIWRVINGGDIEAKVGSESYKGQDISIITSPGEKINISSKYSYDPATPPPAMLGFSDNLAFKGEFYSNRSEGINQFEVSDTDTLSNTFTVSQELCDKAKNSPDKYVTIDFIGYNSFLGLEPNVFPTPGYIGKIKLRCGDRATFVVDNIEVPLDSPGIVLVGRKTGKCDEPVKDVEFRAALTTLPPGEWTIDKSEYSVDGFVLDNQSGSTSAVYGPKVLPGIAQGLHTLKLTYTAKKGFFPLETKRDEVITAKFEARVKKADGTLCPPPVKPNPDGTPGRTHGDPHFINPDGVQFDNHSIGEFTYLQPRPGKTGITVQARQELINNQYVFPTMISSLAIKMAGHVIEFRGRKTPPVLLDGQPLEIKDGLYRDLGNGASLSVSNNLYQLVGEGSRIEIPTWQGFFNITYWVPKDGSLEGMLGIPDGDPLNDYVDFPGFNADIFGGNPQNAALADFWRVKDRANSLFTYDVGEGPETFNKLNPYLKEAPNATTLAPYVEQAKALLTSTCADSGTVDDKLIADIAVDLFYGTQYPATGLTAQNIAGQMCAYEVTGKITNPNLPGVPVVGASVSITSSDLQPCSTSTREDGTYTCRLTPIPGGAIPKLTVAVDGVTAAAEFTAKAPKGGTLSLSKDLEVILTSLRLTGVVTQLEATGAPAAGANVQVQVLNQWQQTTTDANGRYDLAVVFPRSQTATAVQLKFAAASTGLVGGKTVDATLNTGGLLERSENLVLNRSITFTGSVHNSLVPTTPLAGNLVISKSDGTELCRTSLNYNGDYNCVAVFGGTGALEPLNLNYVLTGDWGSTTVGASVAAGEVNISRNFDLPVTALKLSGNIKFVDGVVYPGAPVYISGDGLPSVSIATDGSGHFETTMTIPVWKALAIVKFSVGVGAGLPPVTAQLEIPLTKDAINTGTQDFSVAFEGVQFWRVDGPGRYIGVTSAALAQDGTLYFGQEEGYLFAITPNGGNAWVFSTYLDTLGYAPSVRVPPAVGPDGTIYLVTSAGPFYALKPDGSKLWTFATMPSGVGCATPALATDGTIYINCENGSLLAISPSGQQRWILERTGSKSNRLTSPAVAADGTIYNAASDGKLYAINPDGTERWNFDTKSDIYSSPAIAQDGTVYITTYGGRVLAINPNGSKRWEFATGSEISSSPAIGTDGTIYIGANGLYALNPDGSKRWVFKSDVDQRTGFGSAVVGADGTIFSVAAPNLYAVKPDGTKRWAFSGDPYYRDLAVGNNGSVYVTGRNNMYAIRSKSLGLANSWAKAGRDSQYTGRSSNQSVATRYVRFTGQVVNTTVSAGLAGLEVAVNQSTGLGLCRAITDNDGRYTCTAPTNEVAGFDVAFATTGQINGVPISINATASVAAGATEVQQDLSTALTTLRLAGTVKDPLGRPIVGATISYAGRSGLPGLTTDSSGAFSTLLVYPDTQTTQTAQVVANDGKSNISVNRTINFTKGALTELTENFTLGRWFFEFKGKLTNTLSSSPGLPGAKVLIKNGATNLCAGNLSSSGDYVCYYTITAPLAQTFTPNYEVTYFNKVTRDGSVLDLAALPLYNSNVVTQDFSLSPTTLKLSGVVRSSTGTVLGGATVTASDVGSSAAITTSAADGSYSLEVLYPDGVVAGKPNLKAVNGQASGTISPNINLTANAITTSTQDLTVDLNVLGSRRWVREPTAVDNGIVSGAPVVASDGTIITFGYDALNGETIFATNPNGTAKWSAPMFNQSVDGSNGDVVMGSDGTIYTITTRVDGNALPPLLWAYSPTDGSRKWVFEPPGNGYYEASKTPAVASDGTVYFMMATYGGNTQADATLIGKLYAVNSSGQLRASADVLPTALGGYFDGQVPPVIGLDGTVYVNARSKLYAFTPDLQAKWVVDLPTSSSGGWLEYEWAIDWDGVLYGTSPNAGVVAINPDGTRKWFWQPTLGFPSGAGIVPYDNVLYVRVEELGANPFKLVALERSTGLERWRISTGSNSSPVIGNNGVIYMTAPNQVMAFNTDGTSRWRFDKETASTKCNFDFTLKAPAMGRDGTLYLGDSKFCLFAIVTDALGGLAASPWAKAFGGSQNASLVRPIPIAQLTLKLLESYGLELSIPSRAKSTQFQSR